jgi:drug/metabolite transporter (DMT)-like permease
VSGTTTSLLLVLSALLHALWNTILKRDGDPRASAIGVLALGALGATLAVPLASGPAFRDWASVGWGIGAGICEGGYFIALALALERAPLGVSYTVSRGSAMILVWAVSALALTHPVRAAEISSAALILAGVALTQPAVAAEQSRRRTQGIRWAYLCGGFIAGYHFLYARAMREATQAAALFSLSVWTGLAIYVPLAGRDRVARAWHKLREQPLTIAGGGAFCAGSFLIFLYALRTSPPHYAISLRNTSVVFAQFFAWGIGERVRFRQWAGAALVLGGAAWLGMEGR